MKISKSYLKYFKKIKKNIVGSLKIPSEKFANEDYHKIRVEIKKLNALLISLEFCLKSFNKNKYFKPFKNLFKQAGNIRNYQLEESTLKRNDEAQISEYLTHLQETIEHEKIKFAFLLGKMNTQKIKKRLKKIEPFIKKISIKDLQQFVESERDKIRYFFCQEPMLAANIHTMRKLLKIDFYTRKITDRPVADNLVEEENDFLELLGKWHDCRTINHLLEKNILKGAPASQESAYLLKINREIKSTSENLLKDIKERVDKGVYL